MQVQHRRRPSPALIVAMVALFVALGGTAGAVITAAVPLAKRALVADKAKFATTAKTANVAKLANKAKTATTATTASTAGNALTLNGQSATDLTAAATTAATQGALVATPPGARPASTASALVSVKTAPFGLGPATAAADVIRGFRWGRSRSPESVALVYDGAMFALRLCRRGHAAGRMPPMARPSTGSLTRFPSSRW